jgi:hypothetical protein
VFFTQKYGILELEFSFSGHNSCQVDNYVLCVCVCVCVCACARIQIDNKFIILILSSLYIQYSIYLRYNTFTSIFYIVKVTIITWVELRSLEIVWT